jgi:F-type H+-transporting ATPase subunit c
MTPFTPDIEHPKFQKQGATFMDPVTAITYTAMAKYIGAGLACIGMGGAAIGVALVFGQFLSGALRNPSAAAGQNTTLFLGFALAEAFGIFSLLIALLLLFVL